jgi:RNA polymerase sigma factor (sigma-70 family)
MSRPASQAADDEPDAAAHPTGNIATQARAWDHFYAYFIDIIGRSHAVRRLSGADREDCVQEVMTEVVRRFGHLDPETILQEHAGWIRVLSRNKAIDIVRRRFRKPEMRLEDGLGSTLPTAGEVETEAGASQSESISLVWEALLSLDQKVPVTSYLVFYLRTIEEWDVPEIAELFGMTQEQVRSRCHRVRKMFQAILEQKRQDR